MSRTLKLAPLALLCGLGMSACGSARPTKRAIPAGYHRFDQPVSAGVGFALRVPAGFAADSPQITPEGWASVTLGKPRGDDPVGLSANGAVLVNWSSAPGSVTLAQQVAETSAPAGNTNYRRSSQRVNIRGASDARLVTQTYTDADGTPTTSRTLWVKSERGPLVGVLAVGPDRGALLDSAAVIRSFAWTAG
ncbi:MAG: hypothetical protein J2O48_04140 [Solirubrobacterales bacterium]|nr:hypothetical protein [Solirubrobacterales bacterium]